MKTIRILYLVLFMGSFCSVFANIGNIETKNAVAIYTYRQILNPITDTVVIRFDYKQSSLFYTYTLEALDSVITILLRDTGVKIFIDGYAYKDEGSDTICYYLSLNRALFIQTYVLGRGIDSSRIIALHAYGRTRQKYINKDKAGLFVNCRAELRVVYPPPKKRLDEFDRDEDGVMDSEDKCPDVFGYKDSLGCPVKHAVTVPFPMQESALYASTFKVLDSVVAVLKENPAFIILINGHAFRAEGTYAFCERLAVDRAEMVRQYIISRQINRSRIMEGKNYGISRPINAGKTPQDILKSARAEIVFLNKE